MNIGVINGGKKANIVAREAWAMLDIRYWTEYQKQMIHGRLDKIPKRAKKARIDVTVESQIPPMENTRASQALFRKASMYARCLGFELKGGRTGGGSDASIASACGIPVLDGLGPDGDGIHAAHEHLLLPSLLERTALLTRLILHL